MAIVKMSLDDGPVDYSAARRFALVAAFLKIVCTILLVVIIAIRSTSAGVDLSCPVDCNSFTVFQTLNSCCLAEEWKERGRFEWLSFIFDLVEFISSFLFIAPMLALADVWGRRITVNKMMVAAFVTSSGISLLEFLFRAGLTTTANWIAEWSSMQYVPGQDVNVPLQILSISYRVANGLGVWAFAADDLFLGVGLLAAAYLTFKYGQLPKGHAWLGLATGALSIINFCLELARFGDWQVLSIVSSVVYAFVGFVMLPIWLVYLACFLGEYVMPDNRTGLTGSSDSDMLPLPSGGGGGGGEGGAVATGAGRDADDERL